MGIVGPIGAGKSTVLDAISFALAPLADLNLRDRFADRRDLELD